MQLGHVWVEAGELLRQPPDGDDEEEDVDHDDEAHGAEEAPDEAVAQGQPAAELGREETNARVCVCVCKTFSGCVLTPYGNTHCSLVPYPFGRMMAEMMTMARGVP